MADEYATMRHDRSAGVFRLDCRECGDLGSFYKGHVARTAQRDHEKMHAELVGDDPEASPRQDQAKTG